MDNLTPGPWWSLPWYVKAYRWLRHQPLFKARMLYDFTRYWVRWHRGLKHRPPEAGVRPMHPKLVWECTVLQDAHELERYYVWRAP